MSGSSDPLLPLPGIYGILDSQKESAKLLHDGLLNDCPLYGRISNSIDGHTLYWFFNSLLDLLGSETMKSTTEANQPKKQTIAA